MKSTQACFGLAAEAAFTKAETWVNGIAAQPSSSFQ